MFCVQCGRSDEKLFNGFCKSCFIKKSRLITFPREIVLTVCAHCGSTLKEGKWKETNIPEEKYLYKILTEHLTVNDLAEEVEISLKPVSKVGSTTECLVTVTGKVLGKKIVQEYYINFKTQKTVCVYCSKYISGYYEAVIQIRADKRFPSPEEVQNIDDLIIKALDKISRTNRMAYVSERIELKEGVDYYIGSYKVAKKLVNVIKEFHGGLVRESPKLMGRDRSGKNLYRIWVSLRLPYFQKGDIIRYEGIIGQVLNIAGRKILVKDLDSYKKISISWKDYEKINTIARKEDIKKTTITAKTPKYIQILHPETYQPIDLETDQGLNNIVIGEEIAVIEIEEKIYIIN
jgi:60S ribosomal export protein NMD3